MSVFDDVPAEDDAFSKAAGAMNQQQFTDDEFNALVERVSSGDVDPQNPLHAILREVRYQLRAQPPVQIGTELGEFIGVGPASDARYTHFDRPGTALVKYDPTNPIAGGVNEIVLEPLPEPASRLHRSSMMLAAAALVVVAMIVGAGISRSLTPINVDVEGGPADTETPTIFGSQIPNSGDFDGLEAPALTPAAAEDAGDTAPLPDSADPVQPEPTAAEQAEDQDANQEVNIALVADESEVTPVESAEPVNADARDNRAPEPTAVPPTATPEPTPVPTEPAAAAQPVVAPTSTATPTPPTSTPAPTATATPTPSPTSTPEPTATASPTSTPLPTATATPPPTSTPAPTATPEPTPRPTSTPLPTATPTSTPVPPTPIGD